MNNQNTIEDILNHLRLKSLIIWDNDGTIMGTKDLNDRAHEHDILPNVKEFMTSLPAIQIICSGFKSPETEKKNYDTDGVIKRFKKLMHELPIKAAVFSPAAGGIECWVMIKKDSGDIEIRKAHEDPRYAHLIGQFKKPDIGMFYVIKDLAKEFGVNAENKDIVMIGDSVQDEEFAERAGIEFFDAALIHTSNESNSF